MVFSCFRIEGMVIRNVETFEKVLLIIINIFSITFLSLSLSLSLSFC